MSDEPPGGSRRSSSTSVKGRAERRSSAGRPVLVLGHGQAVRAWPAYAAAARGAGRRRRRSPSRCSWAHHGSGCSPSTPDGPGRWTPPRSRPASSWSRRRPRPCSTAGRGRRGCRWPADSLRFRSEVYQAQGMVMIDLGIGLADALARMRAHAFASGIDLDVLARDIIAGRTRLRRRRRDMNRTCLGYAGSHRRTRTIDMISTTHLSDLFVEVADTLVDDFDLVLFLQQPDQPRRRRQRGQRGRSDARRPPRTSCASWRPPTSPARCWSCCSCRTTRDRAWTASCPVSRSSTPTWREAGDRWPIVRARSRWRRASRRSTRSRCGCGTQ